MLHLNNNPDWLRKKAQEEEGASFSVGGLSVAMNKITPPWLEEAADAVDEPAPELAKTAKLCLTLEVSPLLSSAKATLALTRFVDQLSQADRRLGGTGLQVAEKQEEPTNGTFTLCLEPVSPADYQLDESRLARIAAQMSTIQVDHSSIATINAQVA